eukprot:gene51470-55092_t
MLDISSIGGAGPPALPSCSTGIPPTAPPHICASGRTSSSEDTAEAAAAAPAGAGPDARERAFRRDLRRRRINMEDVKPGQLIELHPERETGVKFRAGRPEEPHRQRAMVNVVPEFRCTREDCIGVTYIGSKEVTRISRAWWESEEALPTGCMARLDEHGNSLVEYVVGTHRFGEEAPGDFRGYDYLVPSGEAAHRCGKCGENITQGKVWMDRDTGWVEGDSCCKKRKKGAGAGRAAGAAAAAPAEAAEDEAPRPGGLAEQEGGRTPAPKGAEAAERAKWKKEFPEYLWGWNPAGAKKFTVPGRELKVERRDEKGFICGQRMWNAVGAWLRELRWPRAPTASEKGPEGLGITWIELAVDFEVWSGINLPAELRLLVEAGYPGCNKHDSALASQALENSTWPQPSRKFKNPAASRGRQLQTMVRKMSKILRKPVFPGKERIHVKWGGVGLCVALRLLALAAPRTGEAGFVGLQIRPVYAGGAETERAIFKLAEQFGTRAEQNETMKERVDRGGKTTKGGKQRREEILKWEKELAKGDSYLSSTRMGNVYPVYDEEARKRRAEKWWSDGELGLKQGVVFIEERYETKQKPGPKPGAKRGANGLKEGETESWLQRKPRLDRERRERRDRERAASAAGKGAGEAPPSQEPEGSGKTPKGAEESQGGRRAGDGGDGQKQGTRKAGGVSGRAPREGGAGSAPEISTSGQDDRLRAASFK